MPAQPHSSRCMCQTRADAAHVAPKAGWRGVQEQTCEVWQAGQRRERLVRRRGGGPSRGTLRRPQRQQPCALPVRARARGSVWRVGQHAGLQPQTAHSPSTRMIISYLSKPLGCCGWQAGRCAASGWAALTEHSTAQHADDAKLLMGACIAGKATTPQRAACARGRGDPARSGHMCTHMRHACGCMVAECRCSGRYNHMASKACSHERTGASPAPKASSKRRHLQLDGREGGHARQSCWHVVVGARVAQAVDARPTCPRAWQHAADDGRVLHSLIRPQAELGHPRKACP